MRHPWPGVPLALGSAALFGASTPLAKALLGDVSPWMLARLLYLASGLDLFALRVLRDATGRKPIEAPLRPTDWPWLGHPIHRVMLLCDARGIESTPGPAGSVDTAELHLITVVAG
jgi:hypothetical protein